MLVPQLEHAPLSLVQENKKKMLAPSLVKEGESKYFFMDSRKKIQNSLYLFKNCIIQPRSHFPTKLSIHTFTSTVYP